MDAVGMAVSSSQSDIIAVTELTFKTGMIFTYTQKIKNGSLSDETLQQVLQLRLATVRAGKVELAISADFEYWEVSVNRLLPGRDPKINQENLRLQQGDFITIKARYAPIVEGSSKVAYRIQDIGIDQVTFGQVRP